MARARSPNRNKAKNMYLESNGERKLKDIANELGIKDTQVRKWKSEENWDSELKGTLLNTKRNVTNQKEQKKQVDAEEVEHVITNDELNDKQRLFCVLYVKYRNKTKAYQKAYGASWSNANANAYKLWDNMGVRNEIDRLLLEYRADIDLDIKDLFQWNLDIARADINDFVDTDSYGFALKGKSELDGVLISELKQGPNGVSVKLQDRQKAMSWLGQNTGIANEKQKAELALLQSKADFGSEDIEDDGFIDALNGNASEDWADEED